MKNASDPRPKPSCDLEIKAFLHCSLCLKILPQGESPASWAKLSVGFSDIGLQVWCERHQCNVCHIDFEGAVHPANSGRKP